ncbi:protein WEAK CHLOROPLAST MOVEMENT UNDER BLUE LIGHT 1-like [Triticum dicoccoides]|uniref:protein WEAK CHLOROPLAST MOVEMENT UNDER BLUE LIGHT 1-like n=1 Tax=Triticum dicoccoides TaxID=85692 RepID=UPI000E7B5BBD|nr:protein WEAK CHLOROPLAST MOVEMENT UNDER BLUE LIGHT 1-like [Triticum dicoccoides]
MVEENLEVDDSSLSSPKSVQNSLEPQPTEGTNEDDNNNLEKTACANLETPMHQELPASLILSDEESNLQEISVEQKAPVGDSIIGSSEVDHSGLPSIKEDSHSFPCASNEVDESKDAISDLMTVHTSEENTHATPQTSVSSRDEGQCAPLHNAQDGASCSDSEKTVCEAPPAILQKVKEDKPRFMHRLPDRQMSLRDTRQKMPAPVRRLNSGNYSRTSNFFVDTTKPIESVKVAASRFGGSINWKTRKTEPVQVGDHVKLEVGLLKNEISDCKQQAEAAGAAKLSVFNEIERTNKLIENLKHDLERAEHEEAHAKEDLDFFQFIVPEMEEGGASNDSVAGEEILKNIHERHKVLVSKLKLVKDELKGVQEDYHSLLIEQDISIEKSQVAIIVSKESEKQAEDLTVELNKLKEVLDLARATCRDAEEHKACASLARDEDRLKWEKDLGQAEEELSQLNKKLSSVEDLKSELETSSSLLVKRNEELNAYVEAKLIKEAQEQGNRTDETMQEETILLSRNELEEQKKSIDKARDEVCALTVTAASLQSELSKEKEALATMQQLEAMASITISSLKAEIKLAQQELETVHAKEKKTCDRMGELPGLLQVAAQEADEAKSLAMKAHEMLRTSKGEMEQAKADLSAMEFRLQAVLKETVAAKESERLSLDALRALEESELAASNTEQGSPGMITLDLNEHASLIEKSHQAEELLHKKISFAVAQVEMAKDSESLVLAKLSEVYKVLEERKQALLAAQKQADGATEGKLAMEQELRTWREEHGERRKATAEALKSGTKHSNPMVIVVERDRDTKGTCKEDSCALVHPLSSDMSARSSPAGPGSREKVKKAKKPPFLRRMMLFLSRRRLTAAA